MNKLVDILEGDWCSLLVLIAILVFIGQYTVARSELLHRWGLRLALLALVAFCTHGVFSVQEPDAQELLHIALRGLIASGLVLGLSWILLPIVAFTYHHTLGAFFHSFRDWTIAVEQTAAQRRAGRKAQWERQQAEEEHRRQAPLREQQQRETQEKARAEENDQRRRDDARARCEFFYNLHEPLIGTRLPRQLFADFLSRHMADRFSPQYVEERGQQLIDLISKHSDEADGHSQFKTIDQIYSWFSQQEQQINALPDGPEKRSLLAQLNACRVELIMRFFEEIQP